MIQGDDPECFQLIDIENNFVFNFPFDQHNTRINDFACNGKKKAAVLINNTEILLFELLVENNTTYNRLLKRFYFNIKEYNDDLNVYIILFTDIILIFCKDKIVILSIETSNININNTIVNDIHDYDTIFKYNRKPIKIGDKILLLTRDCYEFSNISLITKNFDIICQDYGNYIDLNL